MPIGRTLPRRGVRPAPVAFVAAASGPAYDAASTAYFAAMTVQPDATRKGLLNNLIVGLKSDAVWALLDWLSVVAAHDGQAARVNAKTPSQVAAVVGAPVFTVDRGWAGVLNTAGYLDTGVPDNAGGNYAQNSACAFAWSDTATANNSALLGQAAASGMRLLSNSSGAATARVNNGGSASIAVASGVGFTAGTRMDAANVSIYRNASSATAALASTALNGSTITALFSNGSYGDLRVSIFGFGGGLTGAQVTALYNRLNTYLTAVGGA